MGWTMILLVPILTIMTARTPERLRPTAPRDHVTRSEYLSMRRVVIADLALALGPGALTPIFIFYWRDVREFSLAESNLLLVMFMVGGLWGAPMWGWVAQRITTSRPQRVRSGRVSLVRAAATASLPYRRRSAYASSAASR